MMCFINFFYSFVLVIKSNTVKFIFSALFWTKIMPDISLRVLQPPLHLSKLIITLKFKSS